MQQEITRKIELTESETELLAEAILTKMARNIDASKLISNSDAHKALIDENNRLQALLNSKVLARQNR